MDFKNAWEVVIDIGRSDDARAEIASGADVNSRVGSLGYTALTYAVISNKGNIVMVLLENGADVNAVDGTGKAALHYAVKNNRYEISKLLLNAGASPNHAIEHGATPLHFAAARGNAEVCELLVSRGANVHQASNFGQIALHDALHSTRDRTYEVLLEVGSDPNFRPDPVPEDYLTPFESAIAEGKAGAAACMVERAKIDLQRLTAGGLSLEELAKDQPASLQLLRALLTEAAVKAQVGEADGAPPARPSRSSGMAL